MMVPAALAAGGIVFGMANGAIAANITVAGKPFKVSAAELDGGGFKQYGGIVTTKDGKVIPVAMSEIGDATLTKLCQSVDASVPGVMRVVLTINAGDGGPGKEAHAKGMVIAMDSLDGNAEFTNINIGRDASDFSPAEKGSFGQDAEHVNIKDLKQVARYTTAGTFTLTGLKLKVNVGDDAKECF
ncbi:DUF6230 family protein [Micromonospora sp. URMC 103]|uniref:DUF6230 family protein n=1 Tax=Micromonospora sp. URMC 103 TaxID=3423406 RepID=UPI003F1D64AD